MGDMKDKMKGFMKKVNNPFSSSSSGKFKGQGRVLGSSSSSSSAPSNSNSTPRPTNYNSTPRPNPPQNPNPKPLPQKPIVSEPNRIEKAGNPGEEKFDPFDSLVTSSKRSQNGYSLNVYECPICKQPFRSEEEVSLHVDGCLSNPVEGNEANGAAS